MWKSKDKTIEWTKKVKFGNRILCVHDLVRTKGTNMAACSKCKAMFLVNCLYD